MLVRLGWRVTWNYSFPSVFPNFCVIVKELHRLPACLLGHFSGLQHVQDCGVCSSLRRWKRRVSNIHQNLPNKANLRAHRPHTPEPEYTYKHANRPYTSRTWVDTLTPNPPPSRPVTHTCRDNLSHPQAHSHARAHKHIDIYKLLLIYIYITHVNTHTYTQTCNHKGLLIHMRSHKHYAKILMRTHITHNYMHTHTCTCTIYTRTHAHVLYTHTHAQLYTRMSGEVS